MRRILRAIQSQPWAMSRVYVDLMVGVVEARLSGKLHHDDVQARIGGRKEKAVAERNGAIAVIPVRGVISNRSSMIEDVSPGAGTSAERLDRDFRAAYDDESIKAIVLDVDSPGGSAAGTPEVAATIRSYAGGSKPVIAQISGMAASAAYWIASGADEIVATESSQVGSIGVFAVHEEISELLAREGIKETIVKAGKYKAEGNPYEPLSDHAREHMQAMVNSYYDMFVAAVAEGRKTDKRTVISGYGEGNVLMAADAKRAGMIDRIGTMRETLERFGARFDEGRGSRAGSARSVPLQARRLQLERESV